jgi:TonB family protein
VKWVVAAGLPVLYLAAVIWAFRPPAAKYPSVEPTAVEVSETGTPAVLHSPPTVYPEAVLRKGIEGTVRVRVTVDDDGRPAKVEAVDGPAALREPAVDAVRGWQFTPVAAEIEVQVPFLRWHPGPRKVELPAPVRREPAYAGPGRHGTVRVVATVDETGRVEGGKAVSGPVRLRKAAELNVRRWLFRPEMLDRKAAAGTAVVEVVF